MEINLNKGTVNFTEIVYSGSHQTSVESDLIVSDIKPDILKILVVNAELGCIEKHLDQEKIIFEGEVLLNVLYTPEGDTESVKALDMPVSFAASIYAKNVNSADYLFCEPQIKNVEYSLVNSRKLNVNITLESDLKVISQIKNEIVTEILDEDIEVKTSKIDVFKQNREIEKIFKLDIPVEISPNRSEIHEILNIGLNIFGVNLAIKNGKINLEGKVKVNLLYLAENSQNVLQTANAENLFEENFDINGASESSVSEVQYAVKKINYKISENLDGDKRGVEVEAVICSYIKIWDFVEINVIKDAYSTRNELKLEKTSLNVEKLIEVLQSEIIQKDVVNVPEKFPEILSSYSFSAKVDLINVRSENGKIIVDGKFKIQIIYLSDKPDVPLCSLKQEINFVHTIVEDFAESNVLFDANIELKNVTCVKNKDRKFDIKYVANIVVRTIMAKKVEAITGIEIVENVGKKDKPSIVVYFVQKGDSLWKIAKKYGKTVGEIISNNKLETNKLMPGQKLII
jgi:hypothetical protein